MKQPLRFPIEIVISLLCLLAFLLFGCNKPVKPDSKDHYFDAHFIIKEKGVRSNRHTHKFFLLQNVEDTTIWGEYFGLKTYGLPDSIWYSKEVGDTLKFNHIRKTRFFYKTPRK